MIPQKKGEAERNKNDNKMPHVFLLVGFIRHVTPFVLEKDGQNKMDITNGQQRYNI